MPPLQGALALAQMCSWSAVQLLWKGFLPPSQHASSLQDHLQQRRTPVIQKVCFAITQIGIFFPTGHSNTFQHALVSLAQLVTDCS